MSELERRQKLTFMQAEGLEALPQQLKRTEITQRLRSKMWRIFYAEIQASSYDGRLDLRWYHILFDMHVELLCQMADDFDRSFYAAIEPVKTWLVEGDYSKFYELIQWTVRRDNVSYELVDNVSALLIEEHAGYRLISRDTLIPVGSDEEVATIIAGMNDLARGGFDGPLTHLKQASQSLSLGKYADSVRESIHAVEGLARTITGGSPKLSDALAQLERSGTIHPSLKKGFTSLYGFTSDEQGVRHPLLDQGDARIDEADALFMLGACAAFASYMLAKRQPV